MVEIVRRQTICRAVEDDLTLLHAYDSLGKGQGQGAVMQRHDHGFLGFCNRGQKRAGLMIVNCGNRLVAQKQAALAM